MENLILWLVAMMNAWSPRGFEAEGYAWRQARETRQQTDDRFHEIASAVARVAYDPSEEPPFPGSKGRAATAAVLLSIAFHESGYFRDVDLGIGRYGRGDLGGSWCLMQLNLGKKHVLIDGRVVEQSATRTAEGWTGRDLVADRDKCFRAGMHLVRRSWACGALQDKLTIYASGNCVTASNESLVYGGRNIRAASSLRVMKAVRYIYSHAPAFADAEVMNGPPDVVSLQASARE